MVFNAATGAGSPNALTMAGEANLAEKVLVDGSMDTGLIHIKIMK